MPKKYKNSLISTILNEEKTIERFLDSIILQSHKPDEIILVDGGSRDGTISNVKSQISNYKLKKMKILVLSKKGNRAVGRNEAIKYAKGDIILSADAGCILDKDWIKNIIEPFKDESVDVVAGYYKGKAQTVFQECLIPYVLVMPDKIDPNNFLPASRTMAFRKSIWKEIGGFPEKYSHNEDYVFAKELKQREVNMVFKKNAVVYWLPRKNLKEAFIMFSRFAYGDAEARIFRPKVGFLFARYLLIFCLFLLALIPRYKSFMLLIVLLFLGYLFWSIKKNYRYVKKFKAIFFLPIIQFTADIAVMSGSLLGILRSFSY